MSNVRPSVRPVAFVAFVVAVVVVVHQHLNWVVQVVFFSVTLLKAPEERKPPPPPPPPPPDLYASAFRACVFLSLIHFHLLSEITSKEQQLRSTLFLLGSLLVGQQTDVSTRCCS